jgi:short-subunit dehydrogenase
VYISARSKKECDETARELTALGPGVCTAIPANLQELSEVDRLIKELEKYETMLHVLVNNAGAAWGAMIDDYPDVRLDLFLNIVVCELMLVLHSMRGRRL